MPETRSGESPPAPPAAAASSPTSDQDEPLDEPERSHKERRHGSAKRSVFSEPKRSPMGRLRRKLRRRKQRAGTMLPQLIKVFAGFSKLDGKIVEDDIDSSLGFLRYDYPAAVYSELRDLYQAALLEDQDLNETAQDLAGQLDIEEKILIGVQLYVLISRAKFQKQQLLAFYLFMTNLGVASEAIDIVYQLNTSEFGESKEPENLEQPLESLSLSGAKPADVFFENLPEGFAVAAFRFQNLILIKNIGTQQIIARGRQIEPGEFCRLFDGQRILLVDVVLDYQDLIFYFNSKKNVSSTKLYLAFTTSGSPYIEKTLTRESVLEIVFGLNVVIRALKKTRARASGRELPQGVEVEASLSDRLSFPNKTEVTLAELRRRARELGGSFDLVTSKTEYLVSNDPNKLRERDILLSPGTAGNLLLRIHCNYEAKTGEVEILESDRPLSVGGVPIRERAALKDDDTITIGEGQYLRCDFTERIIEEQRNIVSRLEIRDVSQWFGKDASALDSVSLTANRGELICVMGPSGCGKSTLLRTLAGHLMPKEGEVLLNGFSLYENTEKLKPFISFIPHEDAFDPLLTVRENMSSSAAIRSPHLSRSERSLRVDAKLTELGLAALGGRLAGDPEHKHLSGGERKRLNVGLDMVAISDVYLMDEPTSGLSSKDSEHVIEIIRGMAHNKIIFVSIHQPSARLFRLFHKAILLDTGGNLAFFGTPAEMLAYFRESYQEEVGREAPAAATGFAEQGEAPAWSQPDVIFDVLETPLRDASGEIIYEEDSKGHYTPGRRFTPDFWRDRFQAHRIVHEARKGRDGRALQPPPPQGQDSSRESDSEILVASRSKLPNPPRRRLREEAVQFWALLKRAFLSKLRNHGNLATTLLEAPLLAVLVGVVLRYSEDGAYTFAAAFHVPTYLFLTLVIGMFLGLTNSADEIIRDRALLQRERNQNVRVPYYILSKLAALAFFALAQCVIYIAIGNTILELRGMFWIHLGWMFITALNGVALGLLISSFVRDPKTAINFIPIILIPQIILGGALIKYEEMNRNLDFVFSIRRWLETDETTGKYEPPSRLKVPLICELMPLRYSYEAMIISQAENNPIARTQQFLQNEIRDLAAHEALSDTQAKRLNAAKQALAIVSGLEAGSPDELSQILKDILGALRDGSFDADAFVPAVEARQLSGDEAFVNQKVLDLITKAEMERLDYRVKGSQNIFFGTEKTIPLIPGRGDVAGPSKPGAPPPPPPRRGPITAFDANPIEDGFQVDTLTLNRLMLTVFIVGSLLVLYITLHHKMNKVR